MKMQPTSAITAMCTLMSAIKCSLSNTIVSLLTQSISLFECAWLLGYRVHVVPGPVQYNTRAISYVIIQLIFLQQYFLIPVPCNITRYCTARVLLHGCYCTGPGATQYPSNYDVL